MLGAMAFTKVHSFWVTDNQGNKGQGIVLPIPQLVQALGVYLMPFPVAFVGSWTRS